MKSPAERKFVAKVDMPGCPKGTEIIYNTTNPDVSRAFTYAKGGIRHCIYICTDYPQFFEELIPSKFVVGTQWMIPNHKKSVPPANWGKGIPCNDKGSFSGMMATKDLPRYTEFSVIGEKKCVPGYGTKEIMMVLVSANGGTKFYLVYPESLVPAEFYFFVDSKGTVQKTPVGRDEAIDTYRKQVGNYHPDTVAARHYIAQLNIHFAK